MGGRASCCGEAIKAKTEKRPLALTTCSWLAAGTGVSGSQLEETGESGGGGGVSARLRSGRCARRNEGLPLPSGIAVCVRFPARFLALGDGRWENKTEAGQHGA